MKSTTTLLAALGLLAVVVSAEAQALGTSSRTAPGTAAREAAVSDPDVVTGYNYMHASNCVVFLDGNAATTCIVSAERITACTTNPTTQNGMLAACQTGNIVAIYIPNASTGVFTQFVTFTVK